MIITSIEERRGRRVDVYVDGSLALTLAAEFAIERGLRPGKTVTRDEVAEVAAEGARRGALATGLRLLSRRLHSEEEVRQKLAAKGYDEAATAAALARLRELKYLDDEVFARYWTESAQGQRPRSRRLLESQLRRRGVDRETAAQATAGESDEDAAYAAASGKLRSLRGLPYPKFRERLGRFLSSRGFGYEVASSVLARCWSEIERPEEQAD